MDAYEIVNALNQVYGIADKLDNTGVVGVKALSNGQHTTRETLQLELSHFLLYVANGNGNFTDGEVALVNLVLGGEYSSWQLKQLCTTTDDPNPATSLTLMGFVSGDKAINEQNGTKELSVTNLLINLYETLGNLMVAFDESPVSKARVIKYISGMKSYAMKNL